MHTPASALEPEYPGMAKEAEEDVEGEQMTHSTAKQQTSRLYWTRIFVLSALVFQTAAGVIITRYSRTRTRPPGLHDYRVSTSVLMSELIKLPVSLFMIGLCVGPRQFGRMIWKDVLCDCRITAMTCRCAVPAAAFTLQTSLILIALSHLEAPVFQVTYQLKTLFTALASRFLLQSKLTRQQWFALLLLMFGAILASVHPRDLLAALEPHHAGSAKHKGLEGRAGGARAQELQLQSHSRFVGLSAVLCAALLSAFSSVYFEKLLKVKKSPGQKSGAHVLFLRNTQLGLFAIPFALFGSIFREGPVGMFDGFTKPIEGWDAWAVVLLNALSGFLVAATMQYADNIVKCFATGLAIVAATIASVPIFGFVLEPNFLVGSCLTLSAIVLYATASTMPATVSPEQSSVKRLLSTDGDESCNNEDDDGESIGVGASASHRPEPICERSEDREDGEERRSLPVSPYRSASFPAR